MNQEKEPELEDGVEMPNDEDEEKNNNGLDEFWGGNEEKDPDLELVTDRIKNNLLEEDVM